MTALESALRFVDLCADGKQDDAIDLMRPFKVEPEFSGEAAARILAAEVRRLQKEVEQSLTPQDRAERKARMEARHES